MSINGAFAARLEEYDEMNAGATRLNSQPALTITNVAPRHPVIAYGCLPVTLKYASWMASHVLGPGSPSASPARAFCDN